MGSEQQHELINAASHLHPLTVNRSEFAMSWFGSGFFGVPDGSSTISPGAFADDGGVP
jgi:hypothetical protein